MTNKIKKTLTKIIFLIFLMMLVAMASPIQPGSTQPTIQPNPTKLKLTQPVQAQSLQPLTSPQPATNQQAQPATKPQRLQTNQPLSLSVAPPVAYIHVKPGEMLDHTLELVNTGNQTLTVTANITDFKPDGQTGQPVIGSGSVFDKLINPNLDFGQPFEIKPGENRSVNLRLKIAQTAEQKEYPLTILFSAQPTQSEPGTSQVSGVVGSNLILFISPTDANQGKISLADIQTPKIIDSFAHIKFKILAKNTGANATPIAGKITLKNFLKQPINEYILYPDFVLANSTRLARGTELSPEIIDAEGNLIAEKVNNLTTQFDHPAPFLIGPYWLTVNIGDSTQTQVIVALPFSILIVLIVGGVILAGYNQLKKQFD